MGNSSSSSESTDPEKSALVRELARTKQELDEIKEKSRRLQVLAMAHDHTRAEAGVPGAGGGAGAAGHAQQQCFMLAA